jgi:hypothetical protein
MITGHVGLLDRHEVRDLSDSRLGQIAGHEERGVGQVHLLGEDIVRECRDAEPTTVLVVEQRTEDGRRVDTRTTEEVDRTGGVQEGRGLQVADETVLGDRWILQRDHGFPSHLTGPISPCRRRPGVR